MKTSAERVTTKCEFTYIQSANVMSTLDPWVHAWTLGSTKVPVAFSRLMTFVAFQNAVEISPSARPRTIW